jgi:hypothetical protein
MAVKKRGFETVLSRKQRATPAVARIFDGEKEAKLIALACLGFILPLPSMSDCMGRASMNFELSWCLRHSASTDLALIFYQSLYNVVVL